MNISASSFNKLHTFLDRILATRIFYTSSSDFSCPLSINCGISSSDPCKLSKNERYSSGKPVIPTKHLPSIISILIKITCIKLREVGDNLFVFDSYKLMLTLTEAIAAQ